MWDVTLKGRSHSVPYKGMSDVPGLNVITSDV